MTARSAWCQARSSASRSDCSRNSWPGTVRIWGAGGGKREKGVGRGERIERGGPEGASRGKLGAYPRVRGGFEGARRALTCRTLRRLDKCRPWARAAPRRSTLLSGRLPAGPWESGETEVAVWSPSLSPSPRSGGRGGDAWTWQVALLPNTFPPRPAPPRGHRPALPHSPRLQRRVPPGGAPGRTSGCSPLTPPTTGTSSS